MKKTMLALMATVGLAFGAKAVNSTGFENYTGKFAYDLNDSGEALAPRYWVVTNAPPDLGVTDLTAYGESAKPAHVPWAFANTANNTYLKVDTNNEVLYRSVEEVNDVSALNAGKAIDDGLYFDANVQFTASDAEPDYDSADKLIVWLYNDETAGTTNLMITAAVGQDSLGNPTVITNFVTSATVNADTWYRLTVKALKDNSAHTCFQVYVNENLVEATYNEETISTFYSMVRSSGEGLTISAVGFKGTGAVDNLVWTTDDPFPPEATYTLALTFEDEDSAITSVTVNGTEYEIDDASEGLNVTFPTATETLTISVDLMEGYAIDGWESAEKVITVAEAVQEDVIALKLTVVADGGGETETVVTPTAAEIESGAIPVTGETTAIKIGGIDVPIAAFNVKDGIATVMAPVVAESKEEAGDAFVIDDENDEVTINVNPVEGLYYGVSADADIGKLARPESLTQYTGSNAEAIFKVSKPSAEKGFFKVYSDVKE